MFVRYVCPFSVASGYARAAHDYLLALKRAGKVELSVTPIHDADSENLEPRYGELLDLVGREGDPTHVVVHTIPRFAHEFVTGDLAPKADVKKVCLTTWETDRFPKTDVKTLDENFDLVVVPSHFSAGALIEAGLSKTKVGVLPHTFDPRFWFTPGPTAPKDAPYIFYTIGVWSDRKGVIPLLKAYLAEFRSSDNVLLRFATPFVNEDDVKLLVRHMGIEDLPKVEFITARMSETQLRALHTSSHCYVTLTRGEAWGLGAFEACLVGNPVIATGFGGMLDYLSEYDNSSEVDFFLTPAVTPEVKTGKPINLGGVQVTPMASGAPTGISGDQNWAEPNIQDARDFMRYAYEERWPRSTETRERFQQLYGYETVGKKFRKLLEAL